MAHEIAMVARRANGLLTRAAVLTVFDVSWIVPVDDDNVEVVTKFLVSHASASSTRAVLLAGD